MYLPRHPSYCLWLSLYSLEGPKETWDYTESEQELHREECEENDEGSARNEASIIVRRIAYVYNEVDREVIVGDR